MAHIFITDITALSTINPSCRKHWYITGCHKEVVIHTVATLSLHTCNPSSSTPVLHCLFPKLRPGIVSFITLSHDLNCQHFWQSLGRHFTYQQFWQSLGSDCVSQEFWQSLGCDFCLPTVLAKFGLWLLPANGFGKVWAMTSPALTEVSSVQCHKAFNYHKFRVSGHHTPFCHSRHSETNSEVDHGPSAHPATGTPKRHCRLECGRQHIPSPSADFKGD